VNCTSVTEQLFLRTSFPTLTTHTLYRASHTKLSKPPPPPQTNPLPLSHARTHISPGCTPIPRAVSIPSFYSSLPAFPPPLSLSLSLSSSLPRLSTPPLPLSLLPFVPLFFSTPPYLSNYPVSPLVVALHPHPFPFVFPRCSTLQRMATPLVTV
jgi:hypothetical protein